MSGSVAEALLASGSKKLPLLPAPPKRKKEPKTFCFDLELAESTDQSYPEYSWTELVRNVKEKELTKKAESGNPVLDPFASDDEEDLKAMAAKFEAKYSNSAVPPKKKKRRVEDYIDRGAGYDESDPFIDNSDVYDEVVPADLQTAHGGFYINSGSLDFKEVELSEDEEDSLLQPTKSQQPPKKAKVKITPTLQERSQKDKNPVGRPPGGTGTVVKRLLQKDKDMPKKRRIIITPVGPAGKQISSKLSRNRPLNKNNLPAKVNDKSQNNATGKQEATKSNNVVNISSSSSGSGSSSSDESGSGSSSSDSDSSSSEETEEKDKPKSVKNTIPPPVLAKPSPFEVLSTTKPKPVTVTNINRQLDPSLPALSKNVTPPVVKRVKTKNVPLNPKLHPNLPSTVSSTPPPPPPVSVNNAPPPPPLLQQPQKVLNKDLMMKSNGTNSNSLLMNLNSRAQQHGGSPSIANASPVVARVPTPKPVSTPSASPGGGLTISAVTPTPTPPKPTATPANAQPKPNRRPKQSPTANTSTASIPTISPMDIFNSIANYTSMDRPLPNFSNLSFVPPISTNSSLLKTGMTMMGSQKSMPNLKKIPQQTTSEKLVQRQPKTQKTVKSKPQLSGGTTSINTASTPPSAHSSSFNTGNSLSSYLTATGPYKTPPPLGGPGAEISKVRTGTTNDAILNSTPKASLNNSSLSSSLSLGNASIVYSSGPLVSSGLTSILNSSPSSMVNSVPSSLTVQRLPQSITITPSGHYSGGTTTTKNTNLSPLDSTKVAKQFSSFNVTSLLQNPTVSYATSLISMNSNSGGGGSKSGAGKATNSIVNSRDLSRK